MQACSLNVTSVKRNLASDATTLCLNFQMLYGKTDVVSSLLRNCNHISGFWQGKKTHAQIIVNGLLPHVTIETDLLLMYSRCNLVNHAKKIFDKMPRRNLHSWNILISLYVRNSQFLHALKTWYGILDAGFRPDHYTFPSIFKACAEYGDVKLGEEIHGWVIKVGFEDHIIVQSSILDLYMKYRDLSSANQIFERLSQRDVVVWNSMISGLGKAGLFSEALEYFRRMQQDGLMMDLMTVSSLLSVCGREGALIKGKELHGKISKNVNFSRDVVIGNSLIDMYSRCGCVEDSQRVFSNMNYRNLVTWTTLISSYGVHGRGYESLSIFEKMKLHGFTPNSVTFTAILSSCNHSGLIDEGWNIFNTMTAEFAIEPSEEHFACMVDLFSRFGHLEEALVLANNMPLGRPAASVWGALLSGCSMHKNVRIGELAASHLFELEPRNPSNYISLCNMYRSAGRLKDVLVIISRMRELGLSKVPGCSWITFGNRVHRFYQGDVSHPKVNIIYEVLDGMLKIVTP